MVQTRYREGLPFWVARSYGATPPGPPAWAPTTKSGLLFWFKADAGVTQSGGLVSQWDDQSGNGYNATASGSQRPTYNAAALNGLPSISFPSGKWFDFGGSTTFFTAGSEFSVVAVVKSPSFSGTEYRLAMTLNSAAAGRRFALMNTNDSSYGDINWSHTGSLTGTGPQATVRAPGTLTTASSVFVNYNGGTTTSTGSWFTYLNNSLLTNSAGAVSQTDASNSKIGAWYEGSLNWIGEIMELFAYNSQLTAGDITEVDNYLTVKWAI